MLDNKETQQPLSLLVTRRQGISWRWLALFALLFMASHAAVGDEYNYNQAYQQYIKSDYKGAKITLLKVIKTSFEKSELARAYKLLGIVLYMDNNKHGAGVAFRRALKNNPETMINAAEVLDLSILKFFRDQKTFVDDESAQKKMQVEEKRKKKAKTTSVVRKEAGDEGKPPITKEKPAIKTDGTNEVDDLFLDTAAPSRNKNAKDTVEPSRSLSAAPMADDRPNYFDKKTNAKDKKSDKSGSSFAIVNLLPFGMGQFYNGSYVLGIVCAGAQAGALYYYYMLQTQINNSNKVTQQTENNPDYTDDEKLAYWQSATTYVNERKNDQKISLAAFGAAWGAGAIEATITHGSIKSKGHSDAPLKPNDTFYVPKADLDSRQREEEQRSAQNFITLGILPVAISGTVKLAPTLLINYSL